MATLPAKFEPLQNGISGSQTIRRRRVQFGEGYVQASVDSTNPQTAKLSLSFLIWGDDDLNEFLGFFDTLGADFLDFTLPNESASHKYEVMGKNVSYVDAYQRNVSVEIQRVY